MMNKKKSKKVKNKKKEKKIKWKEENNLTFGKKVFFTIYTTLIGFGYFWIFIGVSIMTIQNTEIDNLWVIFYAFVYFVLLSIPSKFVWDAIYYLFGEIKLISKWIIMFIAVIIPLLYPLLVFLDLWVFKGTTKKKNDK